MNKKKLEKRLRNRKDIEWREKVKSKCNKCIICGDLKRVNCHHIIPKEIKATRWAVRNGITLCPKHHKFGRFSAHKNALWFIRFLFEYDPLRTDYLLIKLGEEYEKENTENSEKI